MSLDDHSRISHFKTLKQNSTTASYFGIVH